MPGTKSSRPRVADASWWTAGAVVLAASAAFVYCRPIDTAPTYDEEVYLATMRELHHGASVGTVFLSQPPGFGWLLKSIGVAASSLDGVRAVMVGFALIGCLAAWAIGRREGGALGATVAGATLAIAPPYAALAARVEAEVPSTSLALVALALGPRFPVLAGIAFAVAVSFKLLAISAVVPLVLIARRRLVPLAAGAAAAAVAITLSVVTHLRTVWNGAFGLHLHARSTAFPTSYNVHRVVHFFDLRTPFAAVVALAVVVAVATALLRRGAPVASELWTWPVAAAAVLIAERPVFDHSFQILAAAFAVPAGVTLGRAADGLERRPRLAAGIATLLVAAAGLGQQWKHLPPVAPKKDVTAAVARLRALYPPGTLVATDHQIIPYLAGDRQPPSLVDVSAVRVDSGNLTTAALLRQSRGAKAFVVGRALSSDTPVLAALARRYQRRIVVGSITIFGEPR